MVLHRACPIRLACPQSKEQQKTFLLFLLFFPPSFVILVLVISVIFKTEERGD